MSVIPSTVPATPEVTATPEVVTAPAAPPPEAAAKQFAALAKKERALFKEREALKAERAAIDAEKARVAELDAKYGTKPKDPREALTRYGFSYRDATEYELNDGQPTAEQIAKEAREEVKKIRQEQADAAKQAADDAVKHSEAEKVAVIEEFRVEIQSFIDASPDDYELIRFHEAQETVYHTVEQHFQKTGRILSIPEAAQLVESHLSKRLEDFQNSSKRFAKTRPGEPAEPKTGTSRQQESAPTRTLDNSRSASTPTLISSPRVEDDRIKRALAALG